MRKLKLLVLLVLVLLLCSLTLLGKHQGQKRLGVDYVESADVELVIRHEAINAPTPVYPEEAVKAGAQGLVDLAVAFDEHGNAKVVKILESPNPEITKAVKDAVRQWTVRVLYDSPYSSTRRPLRLIGELRFHFVIKDGVGSIQNPSEEEQGLMSKAYRKVVDEYRRRPKDGA
jgi:hypothetical protein